MDKNQIRTKKDDANDAKVWALSEWCGEGTHSLTPHTFALRIFHLSKMMTILFISRWTFFLDYTCLMKTSKLLPHTPMGETPLCASLHISMITMRMASYKHRISSRCSSWTCTSFLHSSSWWCLQYILEITPSWSSRHTCHRLNSYLTKYLDYSLNILVILDLLHFLLLHYVDVLKIHMTYHSIFFFKTYLLWAQSSHDQSSDYSLNNTMVILDLPHFILLY